ncbi:MAG: protein-glutamate O-methyltransferase CheR [Magnetococcales bacterium]|nr:protein-glutamate O-methyltransferase CheR [Magnetococcales bacterium]
MAISKKEFELIRTFLHEYSGILINEGKEYLVENRLTVLMVQNGCDSFEELHNKLVADTAGALRAKVVDAMTTNETLWFRDSSFATALEDHIVPFLIKQAAIKPKVRIWSAASSTGQEAYSLAMLLQFALQKAGSSAPPLSKFSIIGTDISPSAIFMAQSGRYSQLAISRGMKPGYLERFFNKNGMVYEIKPEVKEIVEFKQFNLKNDFTPLKSFDFIMCRNVLIYFSDELKREIYGKIHGILEKDGILAIGASESPRGYTSDFSQVMVGAAAMYRRK